MIKKVGDIKLEPFGIDDNQFERVYNWQLELMKALKDKGRLPEYPMDNIHTREGQEFLRNLLTFAVEEILEALEQLEENLQFFREPNSEGALNGIEKYNEELADVNHFMIELMVFMNIDTDALRAYYNQLFDEQQINHLKSPSILEMAFDYAKFINFNQGNKDQRIKTMGFPLITILELHYEPFRKAGTKISQPLIHEHQNLMFPAMRYLFKARNQLKMKYWKVGKEIEDPTPEIQKLIMEAWLHWVVYMDFAGVTTESFYKTYYAKNRVNLDRIENGY